MAEDRRSPLPFEPKKPERSAIKSGTSKTNEQNSTKLKKAEKKDKDADKKATDKKTVDKQATEKKGAKTKTKVKQQSIPKPVADRMARRVVLASGIPSAAGIGVFIVSYLLISKGIANIPPWVTFLSSAGCFLLGLLGLSYGVLSANWEESPGSLLGFENIRINIKRVKESIKAMKGKK